MTDAEITRMIDQRIAELKKDLIARINKASVQSVSSVVSVSRTSSGTISESKSVVVDGEEGSVVYIGYS